MSRFHSASAYLTTSSDRGLKLYEKAKTAIEIAKRIEQGRLEMIDAICESPLTIRAVINWRDQIVEDQILLRDVVDLEDMTIHVLGVAFERGLDYGGRGGSTATAPARPAGGATSAASAA